MDYAILILFTLISKYRFGLKYICFLFSTIVRKSPSVLTNFRLCFISSEAPLNSYLNLNSIGHFRMVKYQKQASKLYVARGLGFSIEISEFLLFRNPWESKQAQLYQVQSFTWIMTKSPTAQRTRTWHRSQ